MIDKTHIESCYYVHLVTMHTPSHSHMHTLTSSHAHMHTDASSSPGSTIREPSLTEDNKVWQLLLICMVCIFARLCM